MIHIKNAHTLPDQPGVYLFKKGDLPVYIGKSVNIRTRVKSHIAQAKLSKKEAAIVETADSIDYRTTLNNFDALILEAELIRKYKPKYNVQWKDDKNYLYIKITVGDTYPKIYPVRLEDDGTSLYFGPFRSTRMTHSLLYELRRVVPFCMNKHIGKKGCFYSKLGYCNPCPNDIEREDNPKTKAALTKEYKRNIRKVISILSGNTRSFMNRLEKKLLDLSDQQRYEEAIEIRNRLFQFALFLDRRSFDEHSPGDSVDLNKLEAEFRSFMKDHFNKAPDKSYRIECYDISNLFGKDPTGSMVVFQDGEFAKQEYRKFSVQHRGISDIHMLEEVIKRRLHHDEWTYPDLILLDGGPPQLRHVSAYCAHNDIDVPLISIAKRPDRIYMSRNGIKPIALKRHSMLFKLFQSLRDESHRFAKKYHVQLRSRNLLN